MNNQKNNFTEEQAVQSVARQAYAAPVIQVYGNIRTITQAVGNMGAADGGATTGKMKTSA